MTTHEHKTAGYCLTCGGRLYVTGELCDFMGCGGTPGHPVYQHIHTADIVTCLDYADPRPVPGLVPDVSLALAGHTAAALDKLAP